MRPLRSDRAALALVAILLLGGCGAGDDDAARVPPAGDSAAPQTAVEQLLARGLEQVGKARYDDARGTFESVLTLDPDNVYATYNLGFIAQRQGQDARAIELYARTTALDPEFAPPLYNLAILTEASDLDAAADFYRRVLELEPDDAPAMMRLGFLLQHQGRTEEGQGLLDRGVALDPSLEDVEAPAYPPGG